MVPPTIAVWRFSTAQEDGVTDAALESVITAKGELGAEVAVGNEEDGLVEVGVAVELGFAVEVSNWNAPNDFVLIFGAVALLQQFR